MKLPRQKLENIDRWELEDLIQNDVNFMCSFQTNTNKTSSQNTWHKYKGVQPPDPWEPSTYQINGVNVIMTDQASHERMAKAIYEARKHAVSVSKRDHIKADRYERVGLFLTTLRRTLGYIGTKPQGGILDRKVWSDAGRLSVDFAKHIGISNSADTVEGWVKRAMAMETSVEGISDSINDELEEMKKDVVLFERDIQEAERINQEADVLVGGFVAVLTPDE